MLTQRNGRDAFVFVVGRIEARQIGSYAIQVGLSLLRWNTGFEPGEYAQWMSAALPRFRRRSKGQRRPQVESVSSAEIRSFTHQGEIVREHTYDCVGSAVERDCSSDNLRTTAKIVL